MLIFIWKLSRIHCPLLLGVVVTTHKNCQKFLWMLKRVNSPSTNSDCLRLLVVKFPFILRVCESVRLKLKLKFKHSNFYTVSSCQVNVSIAWADLLLIYQRSCVKSNGMMKDLSLVFKGHFFLAGEIERDFLHLMHKQYRLSNIRK